MKTHAVVAPAAILTAAMLWLNISPPTSAAALVTLPNSDRWYGTYVNVQNYVTSYLSNMSPEARLITDLTGSNHSSWSMAATAVQDSFHYMVIGTYHSMRDAEAAAIRSTCYPPRAVPLEGLQGSQILYVFRNDYVVNYGQSAARTYLVKNIVSDVANTRMPIAFVDNVSSDEMGFPIPWSTTMSVVHDITAQLHERGVRVIINAAWAPGLTSQQNVDALLKTGVDGVSLETAFLDPQVRQNGTVIQTAVGQYRRMLDAGLTVIFIPVAGTDPRDTGDAEDRVQAAFGLMFRNPGDKLFVSLAYWQPGPDWTGWPSRFGRPRGNALITRNAQGEIVMARQFANGSLTLNATTRAVNASFASPVKR